MRIWLLALLAPSVCFAQYLGTVGVQHSGSVDVTTHSDGNEGVQAELLRQQYQNSQLAGIAAGNAWAAAAQKAALRKQANELCDIGDAHLDAGDVDSARKIVLECDKIYIGWRQYRLAGRVACFLGRFAVGRVFLEKAHEINKRDVRTRCALAYAYFQLGKKDKAHDMAEALAKVQTRDGEERKVIQRIVSAMGAVARCPALMVGPFGVGVGVGGSWM